jgi:hypothetical protein
LVKWMGETHKNASVFIEKKISLSINNGAWFVRKAPGNNKESTSSWNYKNLKVSTFIYIK